MLLQDVAISADLCNQQNKPAQDECAGPEEIEVDPAAAQETNIEPIIDEASDEGDRRQHSGGMQR